MKNVLALVAITGALLSNHAIAQSNNATTNSANKTSTASTTTPAKPTTGSADAGRGNGGLANTVTPNAKGDVGTPAQAYGTPAGKK
jgi:hypothetical protein